jgi:hypothetical protein
MLIYPMNTYSSAMVLVASSPESSHSKTMSASSAVVNFTFFDNDRLILTRRKCYIHQKHAVANPSPCMRRYMFNPIAVSAQKSMDHVSHDGS